MARTKTTGRFMTSGKYPQLKKMMHFLAGWDIQSHMNNIGDGYWNLFVDHQEDADRARELISPYTV